MAARKVENIGDVSDGQGGARIMVDEAGKGSLLSPAALQAFVGGMMPAEVKEAVDVNLKFDPGSNRKQWELLRVAGVDEYMRGGEVKGAQVSVIGYGGAAFGGKTYGVLGLASILAYAWPGIQMGFFRRTYAEMEGPDAAIAKAYGMFSGLAQPRDAGKVWVWGENGSALYFRHCEHEEDRHKYQSQDMDVIFVDEATHFSWVIIDYLLTRNRVTSRVETRDGKFKPFAVMTANPGNIGHGWYMELFGIENQVLSEGAYRAEVRHTRNQNGKWQDTIFIPAFMTDNLAGLERDPEYPERLRKSEPDLAESLEKGNWSVFSGQAFPEWDKTRHVVKPFEVSWKWPKWRAVDWGWDHPFCSLWLARDVTTGRVYVYREVVAAGLTDVEQARIVAEYSPSDERLSITFADPAMWARKNVEGLVKSSADIYAEEGVPLIKANNDRINGKRTVHRLLANLADGLPGLLIFDTCENLCNLIGKLSRSERNREDVAKSEGDDAYDTLRYGLSDLRMFGSERKPRDPLGKRNPYDALKRVV